MAADTLTVDLRLPEIWKARSFWRGRGNRVSGVVVATSGRVFALGVEIIGGKGKAKGLALMIGPFWLGFATLKKEQA